MNLKTRLRSAGMRYFSSEKYRHRLRAQARKQRVKQGKPPVVHYFHQVDDPYSHLAVQKLDQLKTTYDVCFQPHLVAKPAAVYQGSEPHFDHWALRDCISVAKDYGTTFTPQVNLEGVDSPSPRFVSLANATLTAHLNQDDFAQVAIKVGTALWSGHAIATDGKQSDNQGAKQNGEQAVNEGNTLRQTLGHYQGAMFYFDGEWYWGIDRIRLLEGRLIEEGFASNSSALCVPQPTPMDNKGANASHVLLEYFPSLRSPYTAVGHQRVLDLIERSGVSVKVRPVMPMLMRGIPAPRAKQRYIITDAAREARAHNVPFGRIVDPFGEPVKRAFALFPGAAALGKDMDFVTAYLHAAWQDGTDITNEKGLRQVCVLAGIDWNTLLEATQNTDWEAMLSENLNDMLKHSLWGVPSFRVSGGATSDNNNPSYACWGQDRIWRVENEIAARV